MYRRTILSALLREFARH